MFFWTVHLLFNALPSLLWFLRKCIHSNNARHQGSCRLATRSRRETKPTTSDPTCPSRICGDAIMIFLVASIFCNVVVIILAKVFIGFLLVTRPVEKDHPNTSLLCLFTAPPSREATPIHRRIICPRLHDLFTTEILVGYLYSKQGFLLTTDSEYASQRRRLMLSANKTLPNSLVASPS